MTTPSPPPNQTTILLEEYKEIGANLRQYGNMRFAQLTLFVAVTGGLLAALFSKDSSLSQCQRWGVEALGLVLTAAFWVMEERSTDWWNRYFNRALHIEAELGMGQYSGRKAKTLISATQAVRMVFTITTLVWFVLLGSSLLGFVCNV